MAPHTRHHPLPKCPHREDFWPLLSQRVPPLLEGGVAATSSSEIPWCAHQSSVHFSWDSAPAAAPRVTRSSCSTWEVEEETSLSHLCHLCPTSVPTSVTPVPTASPAQAKDGQGLMAKPNPSTSSLGSQSRSLTGGSWQPTIIPQLICAHGWQREQ